MKKNTRNVGDGLKLLEKLKNESVPLVLFDPQYRLLLDRMSYGNEGERMTERHGMIQMDWNLVTDFLEEIIRVLEPSGHLMMWTDKFTLCEGRTKLVDLKTVDLITWEKTRIGMGYRTRRKAEYLVIYQKEPIRAKGRWMDHGIADVWTMGMEMKELNGRAIDKSHPHSKPEGLQRRLIKAVTKIDDLVVDPCAGSYSAMRAARSCGRNFLGCDLIKVGEGK